LLFEATFSAARITRGTFPEKIFATSASENPRLRS